MQEITTKGRETQVYHKEDGGWRIVSAVVIDAHYGGHSTPGIWAGILGMPGVLVGAWIQNYQTGPSRLGDIAAW
ncbi:MAG TPA: hypothetical protein VEI26_10715 [Terriglobales bacterium]|nr:hypothetical protein [Terriglobales bacterium]